MKEHASDGRSLVFIQFDNATRLYEKAQAMGGKGEHSILILSSKG
jgi:hypothetical protein